MSEYVADASAVLAFVRGETGGEQIAKFRERCVVATLNLVEVLSKLVRYNVPAEQASAFLRESFPTVVPLERGQAERAAMLHAATRSLGLSYADCVCLTLGQQRNAIILTADCNWQQVNIPVKLQLIR